MTIVQHTPMLMTAVPGNDLAGGERSMKLPRQVWALRIVKRKELVVGKEQYRPALPMLADDVLHPVCLLVINRVLVVSAIQADEQPVGIRHREVIERLSERGERQVKVSFAARIHFVVRIQSTA